ncbi:MAG: hypothetical protein HQK50_16650 [Oligoflexia bacterium]|nr:hypothetical protein [Oligoflexia bacterium]
MNAKSVVGTLEFMDSEATSFVGNIDNGPIDEAVVRALVVMKFKEYLRTLVLWPWGVEYWGTRLCLKIIDNKTPLLSDPLMAIFGFNRDNLPYGPFPLMGAMLSIERALIKVVQKLQLQSELKSIIKQERHQGVLLMHTLYTQQRVQEILESSFSPIRDWFVTSEESHYSAWAEAIYRAYCSYSSYGCGGNGASLASGR